MHISDKTKTALIETAMGGAMAYIMASVLHKSALLQGVAFGALGGGLHLACTRKVSKKKFSVIDVGQGFLFKAALTGLLIGVGKVQPQFAFAASCAGGVLAAYELSSLWMVAVSSTSPTTAKIGAARN